LSTIYGILRTSHVRLFLRVNFSNFYDFNVQLGKTGSSLFFG